MQIPGFLLTEPVTIHPYAGLDRFDPPVTTRAHIQESRKLVRRVSGVLSEATLRIFLRPTIALPVGSWVQMRGRNATAVRVDVWNAGGGMFGPEHIDAWCERAEFLPTTTITVMRGAATRDEWDDPVDSDTVVDADVPAQFIEDTQTRWAPAQGRGGIVEIFAVRLRSDVEMFEGDRIVDGHGRVYVVTGVVYPPVPEPIGHDLGDADVRLTVQRVGATSLPNT